MSTKKNSQAAYAIAGLGVGALFGQMTGKLLDEKTSFLMKIGTLIGGSVLGLMAADTAGKWAQKKVEEYDVKESSDEE